MFNICGLLGGLVGKVSGRNPPKPTLFRTSDSTDRTLPRGPCVRSLFRAGVPTEGVPASVVDGYGRPEMSERPGVFPGRRVEVSRRKGSMKGVYYTETGARGFLRVRK